jgi:hypothetical protein
VSSSVQHHYSSIGTFHDGAPAAIAISIVLSSSAPPSFSRSVEEAVRLSGPVALELAELLGEAEPAGPAARVVVPGAAAVSVRCGYGPALAIAALLASVAAVWQGAGLVAVLGLVALERLEAHKAGLPAVPGAAGSEPGLPADLAELVDAPARSEAYSNAAEPAPAAAPGPTVARTAVSIAAEAAPAQEPRLATSQVVVVAAAFVVVAGVATEEAPPKEVHTAVTAADVAQAREFPAATARVAVAAPAFVVVAGVVPAVAHFDSG